MLLTDDPVVLAWYSAHNLPVTPINPKTPAITVTHPTTQIMNCATSVSALQDPENTSLSIVTAPGVTRGLLKEAKEAGIKHVWLQPGTFDDEILDYAEKEFVAGIGGMGAVDGVKSRGGEGWCVLVDGETGLKRAGKL